MRFLFDQSADFRLIAPLRQLGHDVSAIPATTRTASLTRMSWR
jgi:hypothetical protein